MVEAQGGVNTSHLTNELGQRTQNREKIHQCQHATFTLLNPENSGIIMQNGIVGGTKASKW